MSTKNLPPTPHENAVDQIIPFLSIRSKKTSTDATVREDFPGGWPDDKEKENRFAKGGRSEKQNEAFNYLTALAGFRRNSSAITSGKMMQFIPKDGLYIYFRYDNRQTVMVITNTGEKSIRPDWAVFGERTNRFTQARDIVTGKTRSLKDMEIGSKESFVFEFIK